MNEFYGGGLWFYSFVTSCCVNLEKTFSFIEGVEYFLSQASLGI